MADSDDGRSNTFVLVFLGLIVLYIATGLVFGLFGPLARALLDLVTGNASGIAPRDEGTPRMIANAMALASLALPLSAVPTMITSRLTAARKKRAAREGNVEKIEAAREAPWIRPNPDKPAPTGFKAVVIVLHKLAMVVLFEEFYTRWFFLGALAGIAWLDGPIAFYVLFFIGNGAWALVHLTNYPPKERYLLRCLPHFFLGIPPTVMFLQYGLAGAFTVHFVWNLIPILPQTIDQARREVPITLPSSG